mgnify:CR=1 FL=1
MKRYTIGLITGILLTASIVMFMGASQAKSNRIGRYQLTAVSEHNYIILDTQTSEHWVNKSVNAQKTKSKRIWEKGHIDGNAPSIASRKITF